MRTIYKAELKKALASRGCYDTDNLHNRTKNKGCEGEIFNTVTSDGVYVNTAPWWDACGYYYAEYVVLPSGKKTPYRWRKQTGDLHNGKFSTIEELVDFICDAIAPAPIDVAERTMPPDERLARDYEPDENEAGFMDDPTYDY